MNDIFILILLLFIINKSFVENNDMIKFKLDSYYENINYGNFTSLLNILGKTYIYSNIKIGEPEFLIKTKFSLHTPHFNMYYTEEKKSEEEKNKIYDINKSKTFKNISCLNKYYVKSSKDIHAKEKFIMNLYNTKDKTFKEISLNNFDFVLGVNNINIERNKNLSEIYYLTIGLQLFSKNKYTQENQFNFIDNLKNRDIIHDYIWFIYFNNFNNSNINSPEIKNLKNFLKIESEMWIGDYPHEYKPDEFSNSQIFYVYNNNFFWSLKFKSIYLYVNQTKFNSGIIKQSLFDTNAQISFNDFFIYAPYTYIKIVKNYFFDDYISKNICKEFLTDDLDLIYCNKSKDFNIEQLRKFPTLYLEHNELNFTFELTYKDLFAEIDDKYLFLIANMNNDVEDIFLGKIFFYKYQFFFNQDSKGIGFYNPNIKFNISNNNDKENINDKKDNNFIYKILAIVFGSLLFIAIVIIFIYSLNKLKNKKKKRANELDDEYDYVSDKNIINN